MNVLRKTTHPSQIQNSPTGSIFKRIWESKSKRVVPTKKKKGTLKNVLQKTHPPSPDTKTHLLVPFPRGSESPSPRGCSCKKRKENVNECSQSDNQPHPINLPSKTLPKETGGPQVQEIVPTKERKERTLVTNVLKKNPTPPHHTPETYLKEAVPRDPESPWPFLQKKE